MNKKEIVKIMDEFIEKGIINSYKIIANKTSLEHVLEKGDNIFFINPDEDYTNEDLDTMIDYFITTEEYEKCAVLTKLKK